MAPSRRRASRAARVYKLCSLLLQYPDEELLAARAELGAAVAELPRSPAAGGARALPAPGGTRTDRSPLAQHYVETIDLHKRSGLYLTFYGDGDKRERGMRAAAAASSSTAPPGCRSRAPSCPTTCR